MTKGLLVWAALIALLPAFAQVQINKPISFSGSGVDAKISGIDNVTSAKDAVSVEALQSGKLLTATTVTGVDAIALAFSPPVTALTGGVMLSFKAAGNNTGGVTIDVDDTGPLQPKNLYKNVLTNLAGNDIKNGQMIVVIYDGTNFQLLSRTEFAEVDGSTTNELQTIAGGPGANEITLSNSGGTITFNGAGATTVGRTGNVFTIGSVADGIGTSNGTQNMVAKWATTTTIGNGVIFDNGNVGIGNTSPKALFSVGSSDMFNVYNSADNAVAVQTTLDNQAIGTYGGDSENRLLLQPSIGRVGIGVANPSQKLDVGGNIALTGKNALQGSDAFLRLNQDGGFTSGTYTPGAFRVDGGIMAGGGTPPGGGNILATGNMTATTGYYLPTALPANIEITKNLPNVVGNTVEFAQFDVTHGAHSLIVSVVMSNSGFSVAKTYLITEFYNRNSGGGWTSQTANSGTGAFASQNFELETQEINNVLKLRLKRTGGTVDGSTGSGSGARIRIMYTGSTTATYTPL